MFFAFPTQLQWLLSESRWHTDIAACQQRTGTQQVEREAFQRLSMLCIANDASYRYCFTFFLATGSGFLITLLIPNSDVFHASMSLTCHYQRGELALLGCLPLNRDGSHSLIRNSAEEMNISLISAPDSY